MPDLVTRALEAVLVQVQGAASALVPIGTATAGSLVILSIVMLGTAMVSGQTALVRPIVSLCASSAGTLWGIASWPVIVGDTYHASEAILRMLTGGQGMLGLYTLGGDVAARILAQGGAASWWHPVNSVAQAIACAIAALLVILGMGAAGILVLLAQIEMLLGAAVAPLLLPGLAFGLTSQLGWGAVYDLVRGAVRFIATGAIVSIMARAVATVTAVPGTDQVLTFSEMGQLLVLSFATAGIGLVAYRMAGRIVGAPGVLGFSTFARVGSLAANGVGAVGGRVVAASGALGGGGGGGAAEAARRWRRRPRPPGGGGAAVAPLARSSGTGSAFANSLGGSGHDDHEKPRRLRAHERAGGRGDLHRLLLRGAGLRARPRRRLPRRRQPGRGRRHAGGPVSGSDPRAIAEAVFRDRLGPGAGARRAPPGRHRRVHRRRRDPAQPRRRAAASSASRTSPG